MTEQNYYRAIPLPLPVHKVSGMTMTGQRRIFYDPKTGKIMERLTGEINAHRSPMGFEVNSLSEMDAKGVEALRDELDRALNEYSFARAS